MGMQSSSRMLISYQSTTQDHPMTLEASYFLSRSPKGGLPTSK